MKYNKLIVSGCSFVAEIHDAEDILRNTHPEYVKNLIKKYPNKNSQEIRETTEYSNIFLHNYNESMWKYFLHSYLGIPLVDLSKGGRSNSKIFSDVINYLIENDNETNNLIIIGTTALNRISRWSEIEQDYVDLHLKDFDEEDIGTYKKLYLKYFHDDEALLREVQNNINLLSYISKKQNHKLLIFDNLMFSMMNEFNDPIKKNNFLKNNKDNLLFFKDDIFCYPEFIQSYDSKYRISHPNRVDHKIFFDIIKDKI